MAAIDVADYILSRLGSMSAMKLQKLVYYSQAWALAWTEEPLFPEDFQAWANGPVLRELYDRHRGQFRLEPGFFGGNPASLTDDQKEVIDKVLAYYGQRDPQWLSNLSHIEEPWKTARAEYPDGERCENVISKESMMEYYSSL
jgi:uncharacterized phage-associated protein